MLAKKREKGQGSNKNSCARVNFLAEIVGNITTLHKAMQIDTYYIVQCISLYVCALEVVCEH